MEKLLVTSNFSFSRSVFKRLRLQTRKKPGFVWERVQERLDQWYLYVSPGFHQNYAWVLQFLVSNQGPLCYHSWSLPKAHAGLLCRWMIYLNFSQTIPGFPGPLTLSQTTNFRFFETGRVCRRQFWIQWKWQKVLWKGRTHCEKMWNCSLRAISPFPTVFSKDLYCRNVKTRACLGKGYEDGN